MALLVAPYNNSMRLGQGFNSYTQKICIDNAVVIDPDRVTANATPANPVQSSQIVSYASRFVDKLSDVTDSMNISGSLSIKYGAIGGSGSGAYVDSDKFKDSDLNFFITVKVVNQTINLNDPLKFQPIKDLQPVKFTDIFGDSFISGFLEGGEFNALVSMKVLNKEKLTDIKASAHVALTVGAGSIEADAKVDMAKSNLQNNTETTITVNWSGGGKLKEENVQWDVDSLTAAAAKFPERVAECPQRTYAILTKYTALRSFVEQAGQFSPLDYENAGVYTSALLDAYMDYKNIWKAIQVATWEVDNGNSKLLPAPSVAAGDIVPYDTSLAGFDKAKRDCRFQMISIVQEVDEVTKNPKLAVDPERPSPYKSPIMFKQLLPIAKPIDPPQAAVLLPSAAVTADPTASSTTAPADNPTADAATGQTPSTAQVKRTALAVYNFHNSSRIIYQDSTDDVREVISGPNWTTRSLNLVEKAKPGTPLTVGYWNDGNDVRLYYIGANGKLMEKCGGGGNWTRGEGIRGEADTVGLHPATKLAAYVNQSPLSVSVIFQGPAGNLRVLRWENGWTLQQKTPGPAIAGSSIAACANGSVFRIIYRGADGRFMCIPSGDAGRTFGGVYSLGENTIPIQDNTPLSGGAWNSVPKAAAAEPVDQIRFIYRKTATAIGTYAWNIKKGTPQGWSEFPGADTDGNIGYVAWLDGGVPHQRAYMQKKTGEIVEFVNDSEDENWKLQCTLPSA